MTKKRRKKFKFGRAPLFVVTAFSVLAVMLAGAIYTYFTDYRFDITWEHPAFASVMAGDRDVALALADVAHSTDEVDMTNLGILTNSDEDATDEAGSMEPLDGDSSIGLTTDITKTEGDTAISDVTNPADDTSVTEESDEYVMTSAEEELLKQKYMNEYGTFPYDVYDDTVTQYVAWNDNRTRSYYYENMPIRPVSNAYPYKKVTPDYYKDSLFIGDSRMKGFSDYNEWEEGTYIYKVGLNVFNMMNTTVQMRTGKTKVLDELTARQYENVYLCIGINELGSGTPEMFGDKYAEILGIIRENQPDARIIIMSIMYETPSYSDSQDVYNNDNINAKNVVISRLANGKDIFYLDVNPAIADDSRMALNESYSFDGVHMAAKYYYLWADYMLTHAY